MTILTFDTTHHALWAEELAREAGILVEVIPAPAAAKARCTIALETYPEAAGQLSRVLENAGVPHRLYTPGHTGS